MGCAGIVVPAAVVGDLGAAWSEVVAVLAVVAVLVATQRAAASGEGPLVEQALLGITLLSIGAGWVGVVFHVEPLAEEAVGIWRAAGTVTYSNALGALAALLVPLAVIRAGTTGRRSLTLALAGLVGGVGITASRGAVLALVAGVVAIAVVDRAVLTRPAVLRGGTAGLAAAGACLPAAVAHAPTWGTATMAAGGLALAALICGTTPSPTLGIESASNRRPTRQWGAMALVLAGLVMGVAGFALAADDLDAAERFGLESGDRADELSAAFASIGENPWWGSGPGDRELVLEGDIPRVAEFAHNEYVQVVVDFGLIGAVLIVGAVIVAARAVRWRPDQAQNHAAWAGVAVLAVTGAVDFTWHVVAIPLAATTLVGLATHSTHHLTTVPADA